MSFGTIQKKINRAATHYRQSFSEIRKKVVAKTGKSPLAVSADMVLCTLRYGASPKNYYWFGFYELTSKQRKTFVTYSMSEKIQKRRNSPDKTWMFHNKIKFNQLFNRFTKRNYIKNTELLSADNLIPLGTKIIYKPIASSQGIGVRVFQWTDETKNQVFQELKGLPDGVVETFLEQHRDMARFSDCAINIVRVVTGRRGQVFSVLAATAAFAKVLPYTNATGDAIFANLDVHTGEIISDACDYSEQIYKEHPVSGTPFRGFTVPFWAELIDMLREATLVIPEVGYIGWDVAITPEGPVIIEGNPDPGYEWMQVRMINPSGIGKKEAYSFLLKK